MEAQKPNSPQPRPADKAKGQAQKSKVRGIKNAFLVIIACFIVAVCLFLFVFGSSSHFGKVQLQNEAGIPLYEAKAGGTTEKVDAAAVYTKEEAKALEDETLEGAPKV